MHYTNVHSVQEDFSISSALSIAAIIFSGPSKNQIKASRRYFLVASSIPLYQAVRLKVWINFGKQDSSWAPEKVTVMKPMVDLSLIPNYSDVECYFEQKSEFKFDGQILSLHSDETYLSALSSVFLDELGVEYEDWSQISLARLKKSRLNSTYLQSYIRNQSRIKNIITKPSYWVWSKKIFGYLSYSKMAGHHLIDLHDWQLLFLLYLWFHLATSSSKLMILILFRLDLFSSHRERFWKRPKTHFYQVNQLKLVQILKTVCF